jgi:hypothetical protein
MKALVRSLALATLLVVPAAVNAQKIENAMPEIAPLGDKAPVAACLGDPTNPVNKVVFTVTANCLGCQQASQQYAAWNAPATSVTATVPAHLSPRGTATVSATCAAAGSDLKIGLAAYNQSLAGWGGVEGDYRWTSSQVGGIAYTAFRVPRLLWRKFCLQTVARATQGTGAKGYPGSYLFSPVGAYDPPTQIELISPKGKVVAIPAVGQRIRLGEEGTWRIRVSYSNAYTSTWAENSGSFDVSDMATLRFTIQNGAC